MAIKEATDATFEELVLKNDKPVVVDFWAVWCGPCKLVAPEMEKLAEKYDGVVDVVKVDVDANPGLSQAYQIMSIPTIAYFKPGDQPRGVVGFQPMEQLEKKFGLTELAGVAGYRGEHRGLTGRLGGGREPDPVAGVGRQALPFDVTSLSPAWRQAVSNQAVARSMTCRSLPRGVNLIQPGCAGSAAVSGVRSAASAMSSGSRTSSPSVETRAKTASPRR